MGGNFKIKRNTITSERPRYVAHYGRKIKLREKPSQMNDCPLCGKKKRKIKKKNHHK
jgi:hypothetical protein